MLCLKDVETDKQHDISISIQWKCGNKRDQRRASY